MCCIYNIRLALLYVMYHTYVFVLLFSSLIIQGGCCGSAMQSIVLLYMAMGEKDVSKVKMGSLTDYS